MSSSALYWDTKNKVWSTVSAYESKVMEYEYTGSLPSNVQEELRRLKTQVEMLQGIVNGLQAEKKNLSKSIIEAMKNDNMITSFIDSQLDKLRAEAMNEARKELSEKVDCI